MKKELNNWVFIIIIVIAIAFFFESAAFKGVNYTLACIKYIE